jgi:hypothetical protein
MVRRLCVAISWVEPPNGRRGIVGAVPKVFTPPLLHSGRTRSSGTRKLALRYSRWDEVLCKESLQPRWASAIMKAAQHVGIYTLNFTVPYIAPLGFCLVPPFHRLSVMSADEKWGKRRQQRQMV